MYPLTYALHTTWALIQYPVMVIGIAAVMMYIAYKVSESWDK